MRMLRAALNDNQKPKYPSPTYPELSRTLLIAVANRSPFASAHFGPVVG
jgi:hypothetical protein